MLYVDFGYFSLEFAHYIIVFFFRLPATIAPLGVRPINGHKTYPFFILEKLPKRSKAIRRTKDFLLQEKESQIIKDQAILWTLTGFSFVR